MNQKQCNLPKLFGYKQVFIMGYFVIENMIYLYTINFKFQQGILMMVLLHQLKIPTMGYFYRLCY
ncbi:hypothetical protein SAMN05216436_104186 [bacterium A37T11]|nr:hypothetical protein SAMN05216436_104186 [bacterium A37T11]